MSPRDLGSASGHIRGKKKLWGYPSREGQVSSAQETLREGTSYRVIGAPGKGSWAGPLAERPLLDSPLWFQPHPPLSFCGVLAAYPEEERRLHVLEVPSNSSRLADHCFPHRLSVVPMSA